MTLIELFIYFGYLLLSLNTFIFFKSYRKSSIAFKVFAYYLLIILIIQITSTIIKKLGFYNLFLSHYYFVGQFILLSLFFKQVLQKKIQKKIITSTLTIILITTGIYYAIYPSNYFKFNVFEIVLTSIPLIVYCFFFFIQRIEGSNKKFVYIVSGFFLYILCSTLLFITGNIRADIKKMIWYANAILYIVYQALIFIEWYKHFRKKELLVKKIV